MAYGDERDVVEIPSVEAVAPDDEHVGAAWEDRWKNLIQVQATRLLEQAAAEIRRLKDALHEERTANRRRETTEMRRMKADLADLRQAGRQR